MLIFIVFAPYTASMLSVSSPLWELLFTKMPLIVAQCVTDLLLLEVTACVIFRMPTVCEQKLLSVQTEPRISMGNSNSVNSDSSAK